MSQTWQAPFRLLREQFLAAAGERHRVKVALAGFSDHAAHAVWYDRVVQRDLEWELTNTMNHEPGRPTRVSARGTVWGLEEGVRRFEALAREAGACLPFDFYPAERLFPWFNEPSNLDPDPVTIWSEFLFVTRHTHFQVGRDRPHGGCHVAILEGNPFLASASAIEQYILAPGAPNLDGYFRLMRTLCPWLSNLAGGFPMTPPGIVTPPDIRLDLAEVFRRAIELEAAIAAQEARGESAGGAGQGVEAGFLEYLDADPAVDAAAERLLCGVNPRLVSVSDWARQIDFLDATADAREALGTLGLAAADIRGDFASRGRELLAGGARHLWVGMTPDDREVTRKRIPPAVTTWGWPWDPASAPTTYDGPRATLADPRVIDPQWRTRGREYLGRFQSALSGMNFMVDSVTLPGGRRFDIYRDDVKPSRASLPSVCPRAEPRPPEELRPPGVLLADLEVRFRDLGLVGRDESIHWVGRQRVREGWCTCELAPAEFAGPRPPEWWGLRDLRTTIVAMTALIGRYAEAGRAGMVLRDGDLSTFDHLAERVYGLAQAAELPLPPAGAGGGGRVRGLTSLPVVERPGGVTLVEGEVDRWMATWRGVRIGVEARLAHFDPTPDADRSSDGLDTRDYPLDAPAGTPSPLREAFDAVAGALFDTAVFRRETPAGGLGFRDLAKGLTARVHTAERCYAEAELLLQAAADADGCAHRDGLAVIRRVHDAVGHVILGSVPDYMAAAHIRQVPAPDVRGLLRRMREQVSRAVAANPTEPPPPPVAPPPRIRCELTGRSVSLDGREIASGLPTDVFHFFRVIAEHYPNPVRFRVIQDRAPGLNGKNQTRLRRHLPRKLASLVTSTPTGYLLELPPQKLSTTV